MVCPKLTFDTNMQASTNRKSTTTQKQTNKGKKRQAIMKFFRAIKKGGRQTFDAICAHNGVTINRQSNKNQTKDKTAKESAAYSQHDKNSNKSDTE